MREKEGAKGQVVASSVDKSVRGKSEATPYYSRTASNNASQNEKTT
jgi:hypothetical protein